jgi:hypothetical protein
METNPNQSILDDQITVNSPVRQYLADATRWARFLCIAITVLMVVFVGFIVLAGSVISELLETQFQLPPGNYNGVMIGLALFVSIIMGILFYFLWRFSTLTKAGIDLKNQEMFNSGLSALKTYFIISGVFSIISMVSTIRLLFSLF